MRRYARALLRDRDGADDLVQDCLERALLKLDSWTTGESPRRWLFTIMHHLFIDQTRRQKRRGDTQAASLDEEALAAPAEQSDFGGVRDILDALERIGADRRVALLLVSVEGFSYSEAANMLGIPAGTLMSRVARGRQEMRTLLEDQSRRRTIRVVEK